MARATSKPCLAPDVRLALESRGHLEKRFETTHRRQGATWQRIRHRSRRTPKIAVRHDGRRHQWSPRTENSVSDAADSHLRRGGEDADRSYRLMAIREPVPVVNQIRTYRVVPAEKFGGKGCARLTLHRLAD